MQAGTYKSWGVGLRKQMMGLYSYHNCKVQRMPSTLFSLFIALLLALLWITFETDIAEDFSFPSSAQHMDLLVVP